MKKVSELQSKPIQIAHPVDHNYGSHVELFALCEDGSIWIQYRGNGSNVPSDWFWREVQPPINEIRV